MLISSGHSSTYFEHWILGSYNEFNMKKTGLKVDLEFGLSEVIVIVWTFHIIMNFVLWLFAWRCAVIVDFSCPVMCACLAEIFILICVYFLGCYWITQVLNLNNLLSLLLTFTKNKYLSWAWGCVSYSYCVRKLWVTK